MHATRRSHRVFQLCTQDAEACIPLPRLVDFGLNTSVDAVEGAPMEERASCLFVRRVAEERRRASACFSRVASPDPPPPPPAFNVTETSGAGSLRAQRARLGDLESYEAPRRTDTAQWAFDKSGAIDGTRALLNNLGETNPVLRDLLQTAMDEIETSAGRRLMQRKEYETYMTDVLVKHELMEFYGKGGIPGVTIGSCQALCEATKQDERAKHDEHCNAYAFKRAAPFSFTDQTGWCYLLQVGLHYRTNNPCNLSSRSHYNTYRQWSNLQQSRLSTLLRLRLLGMDQIATETQSAQRRQSFRPILHDWMGSTRYGCLNANSRFSLRRHRLPGRFPRLVFRLLCLRMACGLEWMDAPDFSAARNACTIGDSRVCCRP